MKHVSRRRFLAGSAAAIAAPMIIPDSVLGKQGRASANNRITMACLGYGMMGSGNTDSFLGQPDTQIVAVCDLDQHRLEQAKNAVDSRYSNKDCAAIHDFREIMARNDIDAGEEITFNYGYDWEDFREHPCHCGAPDCVGYIVAEEFFAALRDRLRLGLKAG